ncbi:hypothetical protein GGI07_005656 [Coemansia sp. Benny D115]|nr:hypothetical protein GGI07_005656 [Coemansia sp. Benny D115]
MSRVLARPLLLNMRQLAPIGTKTSWSVSYHASTRNQQLFFQPPTVSKQPITRLYTTQQPIVPRSDPTLPGQSLSFFQKVKGFIAFYKAGLKELLSDSRTAKAIRQRNAQDKEALSRHELQILRRNPGDRLRLVPFGFLVVVIPELIPLTIWLFPGICPSTCVTYSQVVKMAQKQDTKRNTIHQYALERIARDGISVEKFASAKSLEKVAMTADHASMFADDKVSVEDVQNVCEFMGVGKKAGMTGLRAHWEYVCRDDRLLERESGVSGLGLTELHRACQERGIPSAGYSEEHLRKALSAWIQLTGSFANASMLAVMWSRMVLFNKNVKI